MTSNLDQHLKDIDADFLMFSKKVVDNVRLATELVIRKDETQVDIVCNNDKLIDQQEIAIEDACIKIIAMYQPKANLLRYLIAILKVNNDLERISDLAVNIAKSVRSLSSNQDGSLYFLPEMIEKVLVMLDMAIKSLVDQDPKLAIQVCELDDEVDDLKSKQRIKVSESIKQDADQVDYLLDIIINGRRLERIADLCTNIAEDVIYIAEGEIIRHRIWSTT